MNTDRKFLTGNITEETVILDDATIDGATLYKCILVYGGGPFPKLINSTFDQCEFRFIGAADRTIAFLSMLHNNGAEEVIKGVFDAITQPRKEKDSAKSTPT